MTDSPSTELVSSPEKSKEKSPGRIEYEKRVALEIIERKQNFLTAFEKKACNISAACKAANIDRQTYMNYAKADPEFADKMWAIEQALIDFAESQLMKKISEGDIKAIELFLNSKGKERGFGNAMNIRISTEIIVGLPEGFGV